jgi:hypothetical protein
VHRVSPAHLKVAGGQARVHGGRRGATHHRPPRGAQAQVRQGHVSVGLQRTRAPHTHKHTCATHTGHGEAWLACVAGKGRLGEGGGTGREHTSSGDTCRSTVVFVLPPKQSRRREERRDSSKGSASDAAALQWCTNQRHTGDGRAKEEPFIKGKPCAPPSTAQQWRRPKASKAAVRPHTMRPNIKPACSRPQTAERVVVTEKRMNNDTSAVESGTPHAHVRRHGLRLGGVCASTGAR